MEHERLRRFAHFSVSFIKKFRYPLIILAVVLFVWGAFFAKNNLRLNNDLVSLLPPNTPSVKALNEVTKRFGASDKFMLVIQSDSVELIAAMQDSLQRILLTEWKDIVVTAQTEQSTQFFTDHALLYLPVHHLERIRDNLSILQRRMGTQAGGFVVDLSGDSEEEEELVWLDSKIPQELGLPDEAAAAFDEFLALESGDSSSVQKSEWDPKAILPPHLKYRLIGQNEKDKTINGLVLCKLTGSATDLDFTALVLSRTDSLLERFSSRDYGVPVYFGVAGSYEGLQDIESMEQDGTTSTAISVVLILGMLFLFFRGWAALLAMSVVVFSAVMMLAFTGALYGELNPYTIFVAAIILGMGIDYSIYFLGMAQRLKADGRTLESALEQTMVNLLKPMFLAWLTTAAGLLTLLIADFRGFYQFGIIAATGVTISLFAAFFGIPLIVLVLKRLPHGSPYSFFPRSWSDEKIGRFIDRLAVIGVVVTLVLAALAPFSGFENDFRKLRAARPKVESTGPDFHTGDAQGGKRTSSQPIVVLGDSEEELDRLYDTLMVRLHKENDPALRSFLTLKTFVPPRAEQEERMEVIEEIAELIGARAFDRAEGNEKKMVELLRQLADVEPFTAEDLPSWSLDLLREVDGSYGKIGFIYGRFESWNAIAAADFQKRFGNWTFDGKPLRAFSSSFTFSDVVKAVKHDSWRMALLITLVIGLTLAFSLRNLRLTGLALCALLIGGIWTLGVMGILSLTLDLGRFSVYNIIVIPLALGVGIDSAIYLIAGMQRLGTQKIRELYDTIGQMVIASSLTTIGGFVGVLFIGHRGMRTIGELAVTVMLSILIATLIYTPTIGRRLIARQEKAAAPKPPEV